MSYYYQGVGQPGQPIGMSAQGAPINLMSGVASGGTPQWGQPTGQDLTGQSQGQDAWGALAQSPDWLTDYYQKNQIQEGQAGYYDPNLQMRDMMNQYAPQVQQLTQQFGGQEGFMDPYWYKQGIESFDPFAYMEGGYSGIQQNAKGVKTPWGPATDQWQMAVNPWSGEQIGSAWNTNPGWEMTTPRQNLYQPSFRGSY